MNIQPEFDVASIINKISIAEPGGQKASPGSQQANPFATLFEAALQDIDDPLLAETIATLNESGTIMPLSSEATSAEEGLDMESGLLELNKESPAFQAIQLMNGRPIITSRASAVASRVSLSMESSSSEVRKDGGITSSSFNRHAVSEGEIFRSLSEDRVDNISGVEVKGYRSGKNIMDTEDYLMSSGKFRFTKDGDNASGELASNLLNQNEDRANHVSGVEVKGYRSGKNVMDTEDYLMSSGKFRFTKDEDSASGELASSLFKQNKAEVFDKSVFGVEQKSFNEEQESETFGRIQNAQKESLDNVANEMSVNKFFVMDKSIKNSITVQNIKVDENVFSAGKIPETKPDLKSGNIQGSILSILDVKKINSPSDTSEEFVSSLKVGESSVVGRKPVIDKGKYSEIGNLKSGDARKEAGSESTQELRVNGLIESNEKLPINENQLNPLDIFSSNDIDAGDFSGQPLIESSNRSFGGRNDVEVMRAPANTPERWVNVNDFQSEFNGIVKNAFLERDQFSGATTLKVMLNPDSMGEIEVEIIERNNVVTVNLVAQNDEVVKLLRDNVPVLKEVMGANSFFELNVSRDGNEAGAKYSQGEGSSHHFNRQEKTVLPGSEGDEGSHSVNKSAQEKALDIYL